MGRMDSGIAKQIKEKWPIVYKKYSDAIAADHPANILGNIQIVGLWKDYYATDFHQSVINMFAQHYYGYDDKRYTSYDAFWNCLSQIKNFIPVGSKIGFPDHIGCVLGVTNCEVILTMIKEVLNDYEVYIYKLEV